MTFGDRPFIERIPSRPVTTTMTDELWTEAKRNIISLKDALAFGIKFLVAEKGNGDYPANSYENKIQKVQNKLSEVSQNYWDLKDKYEPEEKIEDLPKQTKEEVEAEADAILK